MKVSSSLPSPRLADHVRACLAGDQLIFLDLLRSKYVGVGGPHLHILSEIILGGGMAAGASRLPGGPGPVDAWIRRLTDQNLLSTAPGPGLHRSPRLLEPIADFDTEEHAFDRADGWRLLRLWRSTWVTSGWLRRRNLIDIADRVVALRTRHSNRDRSLDLDAMREGVDAYARLRPFALTAHDRCLNDSLALVHFLACQGLFPQWVIGVRTHPFCAHSWVQSAGIVLNDAPDHVRSYQPILIV